MNSSTQLRKARPAKLNSSKKKSRRDLAGSPLARDAKKLLEGLANLPDGDCGLAWLRSNVPYFLDEIAPVVRKETLASTAGEETFPYFAVAKTDEDKYKYWVLRLCATLRVIWRAPDRRTKEWGMFRISQDFYGQGVPELVNHPYSNEADFLLLGLKPPSRGERLLLEFMRWAELTRYCGNPDCPAHYFIATRRSQKYCSDACSKPAQREFKRRWWATTGRRRRSAKKKR